MMTNFEQTNVDPNKSVAREIERVTDEIISATISKLEPNDFRKVGEAIVRLNVLRRLIPTQELPTAFEEQVAHAVEEFFANE
jgi:hypothetical protein